MKLHARFSRMLLALMALTLAQPALAQTDWTRHPDNPAIPNTLTGGYALGPSVLFDGVESYRMWFTAHPYGGPWFTDHGLSADGTQWFVYAKNPVLRAGQLPFESGGVVYGGVAFDGAVYHMFYTGLNGCCGAGVGHATSPDGIHWTRDPNNPVLTRSASGWDDETIGACNVVYDGGVFYLFYQGTAQASTANRASSDALPMTIDITTTQQIGLATSSDGTNFVKSASNPIIPRGGAGAWDEAGVFPGGAFVHKGTFYAFYCGAPTDMSKESMGLVTSNDGVSWTKDSRNPVFTGGSNPADWDWNIGSATPILREGTIQIWYAGNTNGGNAWAIGTASAPLDAPTAVLASLVSASADARGAHLIWDVAQDGAYTIFRRSESGTWTAVATPNSIQRRVRFDDASVEPGRRYEFALAPMGTSTAMFAETWIDVPIRATLQLHGARPNPSTGDVTASFVLPSRGKVTLELFDLAGRRVTGFREMELDAGSYVLPLARVSRPAPGVYLLRMGFGGQSLESRVIVVH